MTVSELHARLGHLIEQHHLGNAQLYAAPSSARFHEVEEDPTPVTDLVVAGVVRPGPPVQLRTDETVAILFET